MTLLEQAILLQVRLDVRLRQPVDVHQLEDRLGLGRVEAEGVDGRLEARVQVGGPDEAALLLRIAVRLGLVRCHRRRHTGLHASPSWRNHSHAHRAALIDNVARSRGRNL